MPDSIPYHATAYSHAMQLCVAYYRGRSKILWEEKISLPLCRPPDELWVTLFLDEKQGIRYVQLFPDPHTPNIISPKHPDTILLCLLQSITFSRINHLLGCIHWWHKWLPAIHAADLVVPSAPPLVGPFYSQKHLFHQQKKPTGLRPWGVSTLENQEAYGKPMVELGFWA